jgi:colanic acid/amylovoran biosynthesis protein
MHLAILALVSRKPVIAVAYEFKTVELFRSLGLQDFVIRLEDADAEWMRGAVRRLLDEPERAMVSEAKLSELRRSAATPARYLFENPR